MSTRPPALTKEELLDDLIRLHPALDDEQLKFMVMTKLSKPDILHMHKLLEAALTINPVV
jgi:hypothetical protein